MRKVLTILLILLTTLAKAQSGAALFWAADGGASAPTLTVTSGLTAWYKADAGVSTTSGSVYQWNDQSGNGYHLGTALGPSLNTGGQNGKPYIHYSSTSQTLYNTTPPSLTTLTVFVVARVNTTGQDGAVIGQWNSNGWMLYTDTYRFYTNGSYNTTTTGTNTVVSVAASVDATAKKGYLNGVEQFNVAGVSLSPSSVYLEVGKYNNNNALSGLSDADIYEIIIYNRVLLDAERISVMGYLNSKYAIY